MSTNEQNPGTSSQAYATTTQTPSPADLNAALNASLSSADTSSINAAESLSQVQQARLTQLSRTAATLKARYGATDPRVVTAEAAVTARKATVARVSALSQQASTPAPVVAATGWALHGRVLNSSLQTVGNQTVFLVDEQKTYQEQIGFAYTDSTGYFLINYTPPPAGQPSAQPTLYVEIANQKALPIYLATTAFQPTVGAATYQNITLPAGEKPLGDPPAAIRKVAIPPQAEKA
jgi:hypothetical protein